MKPFIRFSLDAYGRTAPPIGDGKYARAVTTKEPAPPPVMSALRSNYRASPLARMRRESK